MVHLILIFIQLQLLLLEVKVKYLTSHYYTRLVISKMTITALKLMGQVETKLETNHETSPAAGNYETSYEQYLSPELGVQFYTGTVAWLFTGIIILGGIQEGAPQSTIWFNSVQKSIIAKKDSREIRDRYSILGKLFSFRRLFRPAAIQTSRRRAYSRTAYR